MAILTLLGNIGLVVVLPADTWTAPKDLWDGLAPIQEEAEAYGVPKALRLVRGMPRQLWAWTILRQGLPDSSRVERSYTGRSSAAERRAERDLLIVQRGTEIVVSGVTQEEDRPADAAPQPVPLGSVPAAAFRRFLEPLARGWFFASDATYSPGNSDRGSVRIGVTCWKGKRAVSHSVVAGLDRIPGRVASALAGIQSLERLSLGAPEAEVSSESRGRHTRGTRFHIR
jgi:hypothetical protein